MIPKAKKNLHACKYHLENLLNSTHFEEVEINFSAFVNSARNTTFVLQKEFADDPRFIKWYGDIEKEKVTCEYCGKKQQIPFEPEEGTKQYEMKKDELCKFFHKLRSKMAKEGIYNLDSSFYVDAMDDTLDYPDIPVGAELEFNNDGDYYVVGKGTSKEDRIPARSKSAKVRTDIVLVEAPTQHLGQKIENPTLFITTQLYYKYLENLVEEWTGIMNNARLVSPVIS